MGTSASNSDLYRATLPLTSTNSSTRRYPSASTIFRAPITTLLEYSGILHQSTNHSQPNYNNAPPNNAASLSTTTSAEPEPGSGEVSIRIIDHEHDGFSRAGSATSLSSSSSSGLDDHGEGVDQGANIDTNNSISDNNSNSNSNSNNNTSRSSNSRYDIQQAARWVEHVLPFSLLLLVVFIRQHLQGFFVTIWIAVVMFKSNDILRKQTALKAERKISILLGISFVFLIHVVGVYWWYRKDDLLYPLVMIPPKDIPPFWNAIFIIMVNDTLVRQASMVLKSILLIYYKNNSRGRNYLRQGQMLTLVEYLLLLYRALLPAPVWYRFFLDKEYGSLFSSLMTGLYLTFKLTSVIEKVQSFFAAWKALSRKDIHYGSHATSEQVIAAGDLCAICQEKMHTPILLRCKHIFCEDCVSEWFERERTCPLCRALVKPSDLKSFGDGSTSLFFQLF